MYKHTRKKLIVFALIAMMTFFGLGQSFAEIISPESTEQTMDFVAQEDNEDPLGTISNICLTPGRNASELNFTWYSNNNEEPIVQIAQKKDMTGPDFPEDIAQKYIAQSTSTDSSLYSNKATATGLKENTEYVYRVGNSVEWSKVYSYKTTALTEYNIIFGSDVHIGASDDIASDTKKWSNTLKKAVGKFPNTSFIISTGDQADTGDEEQYTGFFKPEELRRYPIATVSGNHDNKGTYSNHFNNPNTENAMDDYYFSYGNTLFIALNSNNYGSHENVIRAAVNKHPDAKWKIVFFHHSIYSSASHSQSDSTLKRRKELYPVFDKYQIDMALMGHDHCYTRTYKMKDDKPNGENGEGVLYITANSFSGVKFYKMKPDPEYYAAVREQLKVATFSNLQISDERLSFTTYRTDTMKVTDSYMLRKSEGTLIESVGIQ